MSESEFPIRIVDSIQLPLAGDDVYGAAVFADTANPVGHTVIRRLIGPTAEEVLAKHPARFVLFALWKDSTAWVRACPTEGLVIFEAMKILRDAPQVAPLKIEMKLLLEPALRQRMIQTLTSQHVTPSGKA
jgi:hypothetical protein